MQVHPHALQRMDERGVTQEEMEAAIRDGEQFPAKFGRHGFRRNFRFGRRWRGRRYAVKQVEVIAVWEDDDWLAISVLAKYF